MRDDNRTPCRIKIWNSLRHIAAISGLASVLTIIVGCDPPTGATPPTAVEEPQDPLVDAFKEYDGDLIKAVKKVSRGDIEVDSEGHLTKAMFASTDVTDAGLLLLKDCDRMRSLNLSFTNVTNTGLAILKEMPQLESVALSETRITDEGLAVLSDKTNLRQLRLYSCRGITNAGIEQLSRLKSLEYLQLSGTKCTGELVAKLTMFPELRYLELNGLRFEKNDLKSLASLKHLEALHQLMLRAGLIRQLMAGAYTYLPLGWRAVKKAEAIVREEMDAAGAAEIFMPALQPIELFEKTGRKDAFGNVLINFEVRRGDRTLHMALGPTHEEVVTDLMSRLINSYRQLPLTVYQIQTKFRNEERPRFGVLRTSEFLMKDAYSFDTSLEGLNHSYQKMYDAYCRIFARCGLEYLPVEAESGPIGGDASHEFMIPADNGEDHVVHCKSCKYAANLERADTGRKSPLESGAAAEGDELTKVDTPKATSIEQVSKMIGCSPGQMIKTLIYRVDDKPVAALIRGDHDANEGKIRRAMNASDVELADEATIREVTGAPVGFAGPVGIKCPVIADHDVAAITNAVTGANEGDMHYTGVTLGRDYQLDATHDLRDAGPGDPCPRCPETLDVVHGIEAGHVFKLGTKYSVSMGAEFLDEKEKRHPIIMGCYGIGVNRIVAATAETSHDENGLIWPLSIAPYSVLVIPLNLDDDEVQSTAERYYNELSAAGVDVLFDDRKARPGFKFKDADLIGIPLRVVIGGRGLKDGVEPAPHRRVHDIMSESSELAAATDEPFVFGSDVGKTFEGGHAAVRNASFQINAGEFVSIVGPSGCGKSTLLRMIAGLIEPSAGELRVDGRPAAETRSTVGKTAFVFQDPRLLPWRTVSANIGLPLELGVSRRADHKQLIERNLSLIGLQPQDAAKLPRMLSGGMRMRVSLARALVTEPRLLLLDEPFGALDDILRQQLNEELLRLWSQQRWTGVFVTHNVAEAVFLSRRVFVMSSTPGTIAAEVAVPFEDPRTPALRADAAFARLTGEVAEHLREATETEEGKTVNGLTKVTLVLNWYPEAEHGGFYAAKLHGYYEDAGLDVTIVAGGKGAQVVPKVDSGEVTFGIANADEVLATRAVDADIIAVMAPLQQSPRCIMVHQESGIENFDQLSNVTLAMSSTAAWAKFLRKKLPLENVRFVNNGTMRLFLAQKDFAMQAYSFSEPYVARVNGAMPVSLMVSDLGFNPYTSVLITNRKTLNQNPELIRKMVTASIQGWRNYLESPRRTNRHIHKLNKEMEPKILAFGAENLKPLCKSKTNGFEEFGNMTLKRWQALADQLVEIGAIKKDRADAKAAFTTKFLPYGK
eukprot:g22028.t1